jgi:hypothetical protein
MADVEQTYFGIPLPPEPPAEDPHATSPPEDPGSSGATVDSITDR